MVRAVNSVWSLVLSTSLGVCEICRFLAQKVWVGPRKLHFGKLSEDSDARGPQITLWDTQIQ